MARASSSTGTSDRTGRPRRATDRLAVYRDRRSFAETPEPRGAAERPARAGKLRFVVQKHAAHTLHYDFRLEHEGVLLSWAVPKGPSVSPADRRLAVRTEDHPLEYAGFEGTIPKGHYGAGRVEIWDRGTWLPEDDPARGLAEGRLSFRLRGRKLSGRWHLVRTRLDGGKRENWLLFKAREGAARGPAPRKPVLRPRRASASQSDAAAQLAALPGKLGFTNLEKVLYPEQNLTKGELLAYYARVSSWLLPHVRGRPLTLVRCPDGHHRHCFYQKHATSGVPDAVGRVEIREEGGKREPYMVIEDLAGLLALVQLGALEIHTWVAHADQLELPDQLIFDVDPDPSLGWARVVETALELRTRLSELGLESFVKTTGGKGLHVVAPVKRRLSWEEHKEFARGLVVRLEREAPERYTANPRKERRKGRIFVDYLRNGRGATAIAPYSTRAREGAPVATPLAWTELEKPLVPSAFTVHTVPERLDALRADPWADYAGLRQSISAAARRSVAR